MRPGQQAVREWTLQRGAAGSGPARQQSLDPSPHRLRQDDVGQARELGLLYRARSQHEQPADLLAARQGSRRMQRHQRPDRHPRAARRLRPLGEVGLPRLVVGQRAALFPQARKQQRIPRRSIARRLWAAVDQLDPGEARTDRGSDRLGQPTRRAAHEGLQRRLAGGRGLLPAHHAQGPTRQRRRRLPEASTQARQPAHHHGRASHRHRLRWRQGERRALPQGRQGGRPRRAQRRHPVRWRPAVPATADAVSYTHLDVYKRQGLAWASTGPPSAATCRTTCKCASSTNARSRSPPTISCGPSSAE